MVIKLYLVEDDEVVTVTPADADDDDNDNNSCTVLFSAFKKY